MRSIRIHSNVEKFLLEVSRRIFFYVFIGNDALNFSSYVRYERTHVPPVRQNFRVSNVKEMSVEEEESERRENRREM